MKINAILGSARPPDLPSMNDLVDSKRSTEATTWTEKERKQVVPAKLRPLFLISAGITIILYLAAWTPAQDKVSSAISPHSVVKVIVLPPQVMFEQVSAKSNYHDPGTVPFESLLITTATAELTVRKYTLVAPETLQNSDAIEWLKKAQPLSSRLARGAINGEAQEILSHLASLPEDYLVLVQFLRIREDPHGKSWNPMTGGITSSMSSTLLQLALISTRTGKLVWKNESLERKLFRADDPKFARNIGFLYETLSNVGVTL